MTDDKELIARLRSMHWCVTTKANGVGVSDEAVAPEAADRIEELLAERKKDHANINLKADFIDKTINQLAEADAKLAKAVEALEPFAKAAETWEPDDGDSGLGARIEHPHHGLERHAEFTFGDLRRARATLAEIKGESHE